jgi:hypothetical protein
MWLNHCLEHRLQVFPKPQILLALISRLHCNENPIYIFLFWKLRGFSPNFHIHVSVTDLYIFPESVHIFPAAEWADPPWEYINCSQECEHWD